MRACSSVEARLEMRRFTPRAAGAVLLGLLTFVPSASATFRVELVQARVSGQVLLLGGRLDLGLTPQVEEALNNGIPLDFVIDVRLHRQRALLWDDAVDEWTLRRQLRFHALSGQYLLSGEPALPPNRESFASLAEALAQVGSLDEVNLPIEMRIQSDADYQAKVRVVLDIEALPPLLRPVAYTSRAWDLNSGWSSWKVQR
jgi:hypothetical protein